MPAPSAATYSVAALVAAHTSFRNLIDAGSGPGKIRIRSASDVLRQRRRASVSSSVGSAAANACASARHWP